MTASFQMLSVYKTMLYHLQIYEYAIMLQADGTSLLCIRNISGPNIDPWGTHILIVKISN